MRRIVVIGGGAAGMMAACAAAEFGNQVTLLEQNEKLGKKVYITGKGRCNITNACAVEDFFQNVISNPKFLYSAIYDFDNQAVMDFLTEEGLSIKTERGDRVFPTSDHSSDVIKTFERKCKQLGVRICLFTKVAGIMTENYEGDSPKAPTQKVTGVVCEDGKKYPADAVILATGGVSYPTTGATGEGIKIAESLGHRVTDLYPSLVPFEIEEKFCKDCMGLALKNVKLTMICGKKEVFSDFGEMLFTHFGVSGPLVLSASCHYHKAKNHENTRLVLDLKPALTEEQLDKRLLREFEDNKNKVIKNVIASLLPSKLIPEFMRRLSLDGDKKIHDVTKEERLEIIRLLKNFELHVAGTRDFKEAIITQGGVSVKDVNPSTMESKVVKDLYLAGEMLDVDAYTGGYNLQIAWSTGHLAGVSAASEPEML